MCGGGGGGGGCLSLSSSSSSSSSSFFLSFFLFSFLCRYTTFCQFEKCLADPTADWVCHVAQQNTDPNLTDKFPLPVLYSRVFD